MVMMVLCARAFVFLAASLSSLCDSRGSVEGAFYIWRLADDWAFLKRQIHPRKIDTLFALHELVRFETKATAKAAFVGVCKPSVKEPPG